LEELGDQPRGLKDLGFGEKDLDALVEGTLPQRRVLMLAPGLAEEVETEREQLRALFLDAMVH
jgi:hydroxyacid-oxoacid transhydrogenase